MISAESKDIKFDEEKDDDKDTKGKEGVVKLSEEEAAKLGAWMTTRLPDKLSEVRTTTRLQGSPAIITEHESGQLRRMMRMVEQQSTGTAVAGIPPQQMEINPVSC